MTAVTLLTLVTAVSVTVMTEVTKVTVPINDQLSCEAMCALCKVKCSKVLCIFNSIVQYLQVMYSAINKCCTEQRTVDCTQCSKVYCSTVQ